MDIFLHADTPAGISRQAQREAVLRSLEGRQPRRVLLIPPDFTRFYSGAGWLTCCYYEALQARSEVWVLPALGTHVPMTQAQCARMYPGIPFDRFLTHDWRHDVVRLGQIEGETLREWTGGLWDQPVEVEVNRLVMDERFDLIVSIGQVVPHEVIGMANHAKNLFVGVGGSDMINKSHMVGALYGLERMMGRDHTPVRRMFDLAFERYLAARPILFALTTATAPENETVIHGLFIGEGRACLTEAVQSAQRYNIDWLDEPIAKCVVYLEPEEFHSTWLGNKAVYRTRMAIADGGELLVLAPGVERFGEDAENDRLIRKYGYCGRMRMLELFRSSAELRANMGAAAHLIHGSPDGRFTIRYAAPRLTAEEIAGVCYQPADYAREIARYDPKQLAPGWNTMPDGERIFFVPNPALGLWALKERFSSNDPSGK